MVFHVALLNYNCDCFFHFKCFKADRNLSFLTEEQRNGSKLGEEKTKNVSFKTEQKINYFVYVIKRKRLLISLR